MANGTRGADRMRKRVDFAGLSGFGWPACEELERRTPRTYAIGDIRAAGKLSSLMARCARDEHQSKVAQSTLRRLAVAATRRDPI